MNRPFPPELKAGIQEELKKHSLSKLHKSREEIGVRYRHEASRKAIASAGAQFLDTEEHRLAYIATRMPATYAAVANVLQEVNKRLPEASYETLLDLGSGPGTALWACAEAMPQLKKATLLEQDGELIKLGQKLCSYSTHPLFKVANWVQGDLANLKQVESHDCIVISYALGELPQEAQAELMQLCWKAVKKTLILVEPGTPYGFKAILAARQHLIGLEAHIVAPCPHANACPLAAIGDWCHFSVRLERSVEHRKMKEGLLGYEDEKYSYLVVSKEKPEEYRERILRHPQKRTGHIHFTLCTAEGLEQKIVSKRDGQAYKDAKKLEWGDILA